MSAMRIYEYAKKVGSTSKEILEHLSSAGFDVANHMAVLADKEIEFLNQKYANRSQKSHRAPSKKLHTAHHAQRQPAQRDSAEEQAVAEIILEPMTAVDLAHRLNRQPNEIILTLLKWGIMASKTSF